MLIDVHAHLLPEDAAMFSGEEWNRNQIYFAKKYGITEMWVSCLGSFGRNSPVYMPSYEDMIYGNRVIYKYHKDNPLLIKPMCTINPNWQDKAVDEIKKCVEEYGFIGVKLGASVRTTSEVMDKIMEKIIEYDLPVLQHIYQHRRGKEIPGQEVSDSAELAGLAKRFPEAKIIMAHIGGGGDWEYSIKAVKDIKNISLDISGSVIDCGMMEMCLKEIGPKRILFATDLTISTGIAKFRHMKLNKTERDLIAYKNAESLKPGKLNSSAE